jgi:hypothetical protein
MNTDFSKRKTLLLVLVLVLVLEKPEKSWLTTPQNALGSAQSNVR